MARKKLADRRVLLYNLHWIDYYGWYGKARDIDDGTEFIVRSDANGIGLYAAKKDCHFYENKRYDMLQWDVDLGRGEGREAYRQARKAIIETLNRLNVRVMKKRKEKRRMEEKRRIEEKSGVERGEQVWAGSGGAVICQSVWWKDTSNSTAGWEAPTRCTGRGTSDGLGTASKKRASGNG